MREWFTKKRRISAKKYALQKIYMKYDILWFFLYKLQKSVIQQH